MSGLMQGEPRTHSRIVVGGYAGEPVWGDAVAVARGAGSGVTISARGRARDSTGRSARRSLR